MARLRQSERLSVKQTSNCSAREILSRNVKRFRGGLVFEAHGLLYHSTLGVKVLKKKTCVALNSRRESTKEEDAGTPDASLTPRVAHLRQHLFNHTVDYEPFIESQLVSCNQIDGHIWCKFGHATPQYLGGTKPS